MIELNKIYCEDCLETMSRMPDNFVDSIVTDPPYGLEFMGKEWDKFAPSKTNKKRWEGKRKEMFARDIDFPGTGFKQLPTSFSKTQNKKCKICGHYLYSGTPCRCENPEWEIRENKFNIGFYEFTYNWAKECLRVLKPGGHILAFGGTRTYHRMACAIEDAGFEIRDQIQWIYGSGFPKSLDVSKAIDKQIGAKRNNLMIIKPADLFEAEREVKRKKEAGMGTGKTFGMLQSEGDNYNANKILDITLPATPEAQQWEGWGTALKPANEPICLARKPLSEKTVAENVLKWGTGGINVDGCRIETDKDSVVKEILTTENTPQGRWPANVIHDGSEEVLAGFPNRNWNDKRIVKISRTKGIWQKDEIEGLNTPTYNDSGSAARFYYCAKASKAERDAGCEGMDKTKKCGCYGNGIGNVPKIDGERPNAVKNNHPTVKPIALMRYLCKLVTPPKGTIYDPFIGSGTTGIAAGLEGFNFIGSEIEKDSCRIAEKRIAFHRAQLKLQYE